MKLQGKKFLTDRGDEGGSVRWHVTTEDDGFIFANLCGAELTITDCSSVVMLEFYCYKREDLVKRIAKLDVLLLELTAFRAALVQVQHDTAPKKFCY